MFDDDSIIARPTDPRDIPAESRSVRRPGDSFSTKPPTAVYCSPSESSALHSLGLRGLPVSIIRVGLSETDMFATGYDAIFRGRRSPAKVASAATKKPAGKKKALAAKKRKVNRKKK